jgi:hypothetical protein
VTFFYTDKKSSKKKIRKIIPFKIASKKCPGINLAKDMKDCYTEN